MAYVQMTTKANGKQIAEVFVSGEELLRVLEQQGIPVITRAVPAINLTQQYCLTFQQNEEEKY